MTMDRRRSDTGCIGTRNSGSLWHGGIGKRPTRPRSASASSGSGASSFARRIQRHWPRGIGTISALTPLPTDYNQPSW